MDLRNCENVRAVDVPTRSLYTIYDRVAMECGPIFEAKNDEVAFRSVRKIMENIDGWSDYVLLKVGEMDVISGSIIPLCGMSFEIENIFGAVKFKTEEKVDA